jgi:hypothetical protein
MPREPLDAPENLPKEGPRQVAFGEQLSASCRVKYRAWPDQPSTRLEQPRLEARRLAEEVGQRKLPIVSAARISEVLLDQGIKPETFVQLTRQ